ncbi:Serine/threonine protein kinase [Giardia duodenalis]|uniref:Serine/threonine protein kinase n=1 Tax=Giardia intestinalis TaxID=5741 RepID=V6TLA7_GIAIN|nr:Serine/threonine protein kinase [Giardia intestinalis]
MSNTQSTFNALPSGNDSHEVSSSSPDHWLADQGDEIGKGVHGVIYSFKNDSSLVLKEILNDHVSTATFKTLLERLRTFATLKHPNIVDCQGVLETDISVYLRMKRYGTSLDAICRSYRRRKQTFPQRLIFSIIRQVAMGLAHLHKWTGSAANGDYVSSFVHGNLKPTNILANKDESDFVISDAGIYGGELEDFSSTLGLAQMYMAPETLLHEQYFPESDIWSLGVILYELATGTKIPFLKSDTPKNVFVEGWTPDLSEVRDPVFKAILEHIFTLDPHARLTADELVGLLHESIPPICVTYMLTTRRLERDLRECKQQIDSLSRDNLELRTQLANLATTTVPVHHTVVGPSAGKQEVKAQQGQGKPLFPPKLKSTTLTKLMAAARSNNVAVAKPLILSKTDVCAKDDLGMTALMHAARTQSLDVAKLLVCLERGMQDYTGKTALIHAAIDGRLTMVKYLLEHEKTLSDVHGITALMYAVIYGHRKLVTILKDEECRLQDNEGQTALMYAADNNNCGIINILAQHEAMVKDSNGHTAFLHALLRGHKEAATLLLQYDDPVDDIGRTALMRAVDEDNLDLLPFLIPLQKGLRTLSEEAIGSYFVTGRTALMGASICNNLEAIRLLVEHEAQIQDSNGYTALMFAAQAANYEATQILLPYEQGIRNAQGKTAAILAEECNCREIINLMKPYREEIDSLKDH